MTEYGTTLHNKLMHNAKDDRMLHVLQLSPFVFSLEYKNNGDYRFIY